jgi:endonuclease/exonuclease/phosphatase (EEP) superfamily protein YafD
MRWIDALAKLAAAATILVSLLPLGARAWWVLDLTSHFRLQYLALAVPLLVVLAARRQLRWCAGLILAIAINVAAVFPYLPSPARVVAATGAAAPIKMLTVNVSYREFASQRLLEIVRDASPDLLLVVEYTPHGAQLIDAELDAAYPQHLKMPALGAYGIALWSRYELEAAESRELGPTASIETKVRGPTGPFTLLGVHLRAPLTGRRAAERNYQLELLAERRASIAGPLLVAGDFNITPYSPFFADWLADSGLTDSRRGRTLSTSWPTVLPIAGIPIDHCAVSDEFQIIAHRRLLPFGSDHYGILTELVLTNDGSSQ